MRSYYKILSIIIGLSFLTSCDVSEKSCPEMISYLQENGVSYKKLSKATGIPTFVLSHPDRCVFNKYDSLSLSVQYNFFIEHKQLTQNTHVSINQNMRQADKKALIESYRNFEESANEKFITGITSQIIEYNDSLIDEFIDSNIDCISSIKYSFKSKEDTEKELNAKLIDFFEENNPQRLFQDSLGAYFTKIHDFRKEGVSRLLKANPSLNYEKINASMTSAPVNVNYGVNSVKDCSYHIVAFMDHCIETLFTPINWLIGLIPQKVLLWITIILFVAAIICIYLGLIHISTLFGVADIIMLIISIIKMLYGDPYAEIRESLNNQSQIYYKEQLNKQLIDMNNGTKEYFDNLQTLF